MKQYSRTVRAKGETRRLPKNDPPEKWREKVEAVIRRYYGPPTGWSNFSTPPVESCPKTEAWCLKQSPAIFGSLSPRLAPGGYVDAFRVERHDAAKPAYLQEAIRILNTDEAEEAAAWFASAAEAAEKGLIVSPDRAEDKRTSALSFLAYGIVAIAELACDEQAKEPLRISAKDAKKVADAIRTLERHASFLLDYDEAKEWLAVFESPTWSKPKGRPRRRTTDAILQLTDINLKVFNHEVFEATAALMKAAFPEGRRWTIPSVRTTYRETRKEADLGLIARSPRSGEYGKGVTRTLVLQANEEDS